MTLTEQARGRVVAFDTIPRTWSSRARFWRCRKRRPRSVISRFPWRTGKWKWTGPTYCGMHGVRPELERMTHAHCTFIDETGRWGRRGG